MGKDRFSRFKPINYSSSWKATGSFQPTTPSKPRLTTEQLDMIGKIQNDFREHMNDWEKGFVRNLIVSNFQLTKRQKVKLRDIITRYKSKVVEWND